MASDDFIVELLHAEKLRLMDRLDKAQRKMKTEFNTEDAAELGRIADTLQKVCKRLEVNTNVRGTGNSNSAWPCNTLPTQPKYEVLAPEDFLVSTENNLNLGVALPSPATDSLHDYGLGRSSTQTTERPVSRRPDMIQCIKCHDFMDNAHGDSPQCSKCIGEGEDTAMPSPFAEFRNRHPTSHTHLRISSLSSEDELAFRRSGLPELHSVQVSTNLVSAPPEHGQTPKAQNDSLLDAQIDDSHSAIPVTRKERRKHLNYIPQMCPGTLYTHLVKYEGQPVELSCYICEANCKANNGNYFKGALAYCFHVVSHASEAKLHADEIFTRAKTRGALLNLVEADVSRIENGRDPIHVRLPHGGYKVIDNVKGAKIPIIGRKVIKENSIRRGQVSDSHGAPDYDQLDKNRYPTIVFINGAWFAISCHICGANADSGGKSNNHGCFFNGLEGLTSHMMDKHIFDMTAEEFQAKDWRKTANLCRTIEVSDEDVMRIRGGKTPEISITGTYGSKKTWKDTLTPRLSPHSLSNTKKSSFQSSAGSGTNRPSSEDTIKQGENIFVQFTKKASASKLQTVRASQGYRQHPDNQRPSDLTKKKRHSEPGSSGADTHDHRLSHTAFSRMAPTEYEQMQGIVASAKNGEDYVTPPGNRKKGKKRQRAEIDYDYDNGTSQSESSEEEPLSQRRTRSFEG